MAYFLAKNGLFYLTPYTYISNKKSYHQIRTQSDELCKEYGLSVIAGDLKGKFKGVSYKEYQERKSGNSYKAKLQYAIDSAIKRSKDWNDFLEILKHDGYEIKPGKHVSFRKINQERFTRSKTIGPDYTEDRIKERIANRVHSKLTHTAKQHNFTKVVDIKSNKLASESIGFARWLKLQNLKNMAKTWQDINQNDISDVDAFFSYVEKVHDDFIKTQGELRQIEKQIHDAADQLKNITTYKKCKSIYTGYENSIDKDAYLRVHESKIILFEAARELLGTTDIKVKIDDMPTLNRTIQNLTDEANKLKLDLDVQKKNVSETNQLKRNLESYLKTDVLRTIKNEVIK